MKESLSVFRVYWRSVLSKGLRKSGSFSRLNMLMKITVPLRTEVPFLVNLSNELDGITGTHTTKTELPSQRCLRVFFCLLFHQTENRDMSNYVNIIITSVKMDQYIFNKGNEKALIMCFMAI